MEIAMTEEHKRKFQGIWIPAEIWLSEKLTLQEKVFLVEINSLDNEDGCYANNRYFAEFFGISVTRVSLVIKSLIGKKCIRAIYIKEKGNKRSLRIIKGGSLTKVKEVINKPERPSLTNVKDPHKHKLKHSNTTNNITNNTINNGKEAVIPLSLNEDRFIDKWHEWLSYRSEIKKKLYPTTAIAQLKKLETWGIDKAIKAIEESIEKGWQGLFEPKQNKEKQKKSENDGSNY
jgi:hypothetical protein